MGQKFIDFLLAHKISSHTIALALFGFATLYTTDTQFADAVKKLLGHWPNLIVWLWAASIAYLRYSSSLRRFTQ